MSDDRNIENAETRDFVEQHKFTELLNGKLCHATTPDNFLAIISDGLILAETSGNGLHPRREGAPESACMRVDAVSLFDFDVDDEDLFPVHQRLEGVYRYEMHWWNYLCRGRACVVITLDGQIRNSTIRPAEKGQFIRGTEKCYPDNIPLSLFTGYIFRTGDLWTDGAWNLQQYDAYESDRLIDDISTWRKQNDTSDLEAHLDNLSANELQQMIENMDGDE